MNQTRQLNPMLWIGIFVLLIFSFWMIQGAAIAQTPQATEEPADNTQQVEPTPTQPAAFTPTPTLPVTLTPTSLVATLSDFEQTATAVSDLFLTLTPNATVEPEVTATPLPVTPIPTVDPLILTATALAGGVVTSPQPGVGANLPKVRVDGVIDVIDEPVNMRLGPGLEYHSIGVMRPEARIEVIGFGRNNGDLWYAVLTDDDGPGWIRADLVRLPATARNTLPMLSFIDVIYIAEQPFQFGHMFWIDSTDEIYVLYDEGDSRGSYEVYEDTWVERDPERERYIAPPRFGLLQPIRGFGKVWLNATGVRDTIGWGVWPEYGNFIRFEYFVIVDIYADGSYDYGAEYFYFPSGSGSEFRLNRTEKTWVRVR